MLKTFFVIIICKLLHFIGSIAGKGSSLPGKIALRLDPGILNRVKLCKYVVAVTGSNGKTSTVEMIAHILRSNHLRVAYNREGSNQIEGVTTLILCNCDMFGRVKTDALIIESDERFARHTFAHFTPTHYVITNLYRDQLTRNGHPEWIYDIVAQSIKPQSTLLLNADDPLISLFGKDRDNVIWFGLEETAQSTKQSVNIYNDNHYCPNCKHVMQYEYYHFNHIGKYHCENCGHYRHQPDYAVTQVDLENGVIVVNNHYRITLNLKSVYNVYNILSAYAVTNLLGISQEVISQDISNYVLKNGRVVNFKVGNHAGTLLTSKHENSISYNQSIQLAVSSCRDCTVVIIVDAISRKYFTSETSWLWDIEFERLNQPHIKNVVLAGKYCYDLANRFEYTQVKQENILVEPDIDCAVKWLEKNAQPEIFVITCFSDKDKFLNRVK